VPPPGILASWFTNNEPLPVGTWDGKFWSEAQTSRASNNSELQAPIGGMNAIRFVLTTKGTNNINDIKFNVAIDWPGPDPTCWSDLQNNSVVALAPMLANLDTTLDVANQRGFYICRVSGAHSPFTVTAEASMQ
jgi:hypothetical protein